MERTAAGVNLRCHAQFIDAADIVVPSSAPTLFYFCTNHSGMGGQANTPATSAALEQSTLTLSTSLASSPADNAVVTFTTVSKIDTLSHLEGSVCKVIADDRMLADETVSSGSVTIDAPASTYVEVGLEYLAAADPLVDNAVNDSAYTHDAGRDAIVWRCRLSQTHHRRRRC